MSAPGTDARAVAWRIVRAVTADGAWTGPVVDRALRGSGLDARDRAFASNLALETLRWQGTLDWALGHVVSRPLDRVDDDLRDLLRCGAWQLLYGRMPDRAAVSATVDVARAELGARTVGFANGVLRALARTRSELPWPDPATVEGRALRLGYPEWVVAAADERFGPDAERELAAGNDPAGLTVRTPVDGDGTEQLVAAGATVERGRLAPEARHVDGVAPATVLARVPGAVIQDESSMVVARALHAALAAPGTVLDVSAAPGGKTTHLAQLGHRVVAADRSERRLALVGELADRLDLPIALIAADGTRPPWRPDAFDGVLLDAPCSGLGTVRRRPELRWRRTAGDVPTLAALQARLLEAAAATVTPGGALAYSVCTWTRAETIDVVAGFLDAHPDFATEPVAGVDAGAADRDGPGLQLSPATHGCDGMYVAVLRRRG